MFYTKDGEVRTIQTDSLVCPIDNIDFVINELITLRDKARATQDRSFLNWVDHSKPTKPEPVVEEEEGVDVTPPDEIFTSEGIDRFYKADDGFVISTERWEEDSIRNWSNYASGADLFNVYQKHAEMYCQWCMNEDKIPTYVGFRNWLISLKVSLTPPNLEY